MRTARPVISIIVLCIIIVLLFWWVGCLITTPHRPTFRTGWQDGEGRWHTPPSGVDRIIGIVNETLNP